MSRFDITAEVIGDRVAVKPTSPAGLYWANKNIKGSATVLDYNLHAWIVAPRDLSDIFIAAREDNLSCVYQGEKSA